MTISSVLLWLGYLDFGIGNGLRNKLSEALAIENKELAKRYVSTAYWAFSKIAVIVIVLLIIVNQFLDWNTILKAPEELHNILKPFMTIVLSLFVLQVLLKLINSVVNAHQKPAINGLLTLVVNVFSVLAILFLLKYGNNSFLVFGLTAVLIPIFVFILATIFLFKKEFNKISPAKDFITKSLSKSLTKIGYQFFVIQVSGLIVFTANNFIITQLYGPEEVTVFNIAYRYFYFIPMVFSVLLTPFWSAFTEAYIKKEMTWIKKTLKTLLAIWLGFSIITLLMIVFAEYFYSIWIGKTIKIPFALSLTMGIFTIVSNWNNVFAYFLNGIGKIKLQYYSSIFTAIINIPLAIYFSKTMELQSTGIVLATCLCLVIASVWAPVQCRKIIRGTATGIWNK